jgi:hypothetical protein
MTYKIEIVQNKIARSQRNIEKMSNLSNSMYKLLIGYRTKRPLKKKSFCTIQQLF